MPWDIAMAKAPENSSLMLKVLIEVIVLLSLDATTNHASSRGSNILEDIRFRGSV